MIADPGRRGESLASFYHAVAPRLWRDVTESGTLPAFATDEAEAGAEREWECFALYACVRGLVAAGGFNRETAIAIDAMHDRVLGAWRDEPEGAESHDQRRARVSERYAEYGEIGQEGGASGAATVGERLGAACARHVEAMGPASSATPERRVKLASLLGDLHESIAAGAADAVRLSE